MEFTTLPSDKPHLLLVPGLLCTAELFAPQIAALERTASITVADTRRHRTFVDMTTAILAEAPPKFALGGLSMGGYIAFEIVRQAPDRVTKLALLDTNARADRPEQAEQRRALVALASEKGVAQAVALLWPFLVHKDRHSDESLKAVVDRMAEDIGADTFARQQEAIISRPDNRPSLPEIRCPTVIIVGAEDALTPVKVAEEMHSGIGGSRLEIIPGCGHLSTIERPETVTSILREWL
jgi:pimeloyl-ACP methyl ester carboxylesterase